MKAGTPLGLEAKAFVDRGELVSDEITNSMVRSRLEEADAQNGFLLDGWPRNVSQAEVLRAIMAEKKTPLNAVLEFSIPSEEIIGRLSSRMTCRQCGKPAEVGFTTCPFDGGELYQREDDKAEVIARRLAVYEEQTAPIIHFYRTEGLLITVSAVGDVAEITHRAIDALSRVQ
jgi:adenylate kinase